MRWIIFFSMWTLWSCSKVKNDVVTNDAQPLVIAYYAGDAAAIQSYDLHGVDQIIYSFMHLKGNRLTIDNEADSLALGALINQKIKYPQLKVLVSLGGWGGCETCSSVFSTAEGRAEFVKSCVEVIDFYGADGIDLDWEYPAIAGYPGHEFQPADRENFTALVQSLRQAMGEDLVLSFAAGASNNFIENSIEWDKVMPEVDHVNIMTYDFYGAGSSMTGHHTALGSNTFEKRSAVQTIEELYKKGVKPEQIVLGAAFYVKTFKNIDPSNNGLFQPAEWNRSYSQPEFETIKSEFDFYWDEAAQSPYAYSADNHIFATFDDHRSIESKVSYVLNQNLKGIMFWQLMNDHKKDGLLKTMVNAVKSD